MMGNHSPLQNTREHLVVRRLDPAHSMNFSLIKAFSEHAGCLLDSSSYVSGLQASGPVQRALAAVLLEHAVPKLEALIAVSYPYRAQGHVLNQKPGYGCTNISSIKV